MKNLLVLATIALLSVSCGKTGAVGQSGANGKDGTSIVGEKGETGSDGQDYSPREVSLFNQFVRYDDQSIGFLTVSFKDLGNAREVLVVTKYRKSNINNNPRDFDCRYKVIKNGSDLHGMLTNPVKTQNLETIPASSNDTSCPKPLKSVNIVYTSLNESEMNFCIMSLTSTECDTYKLQ